MIERKQNEMAEVPDISKERGTPSIPWIGILDLHSVDQLVQYAIGHHLISSSSHLHAVCRNAHVFELCLPDHIGQNSDGYA